MILASGVSAGVGISRAVILIRKELNISCPTTFNAEKEIGRIERCVKQASDELRSVYNSVNGMEDPELHIANRYISAISNPQLTNDIKKRIVQEEVNAEYAILDTMDSFSKVVKTLDDEYLYEKCEDIEEIKLRLLSKLTGYGFFDLDSINQECILVAEDLTPGDVINMNPIFIKGIVTISGGPTSKFGIIARNMNIPAVTGAGSEGAHIKNEDILIVDGNKGKVIVNPDYNELAAYSQNVKM